MEFAIKPKLYLFDTCAEFCKQMELKESDLVVTNAYIFQPHFGNLGLKCHLLFQEKYGSGEPSDEMVEKIYADIRDLQYDRVVAIGGGTVLDISKLLSLKYVSPVLDLYDRKLPLEKDKQLLLVPTTCGTGSEVTNISILELKSRKTKLGLAVDELYASGAVLIPELLQGLPFPVFATSSIDALVHAVESWLSPKATCFTQLFAEKAITMLIQGYQQIAQNGPEARIPLLPQFLLASNYAGISFSNAGTGAVHAMSYPFGAQYHVPHGESNYVLFTGVMKTYQRLDPNGRISRMNAMLAELLGCSESDVYEELEKLLNNVLQKKPLHAYGVKREDLQPFTENVMTKQGRLMANTYVPLSEQEVYNLYCALY